MDKHTDIAVYDGEPFTKAEEEFICEKCGKNVAPREKRMAFASIHNGNNPNAATLSWCDLCLDCALKVVDLFKKQ